MPESTPRRPSAVPTAGSSGPLSPPTSGVWAPNERPFSAPASPNPEAAESAAEYDESDERQSMHKDSYHLAHRRPSNKSSSEALGLTRLSLSSAQNGKPADEQVPRTDNVHGSPVFNQHVEDAEAIDLGFVGDGKHDVQNAELLELYTSFQRCLDLRDKYIRLSKQRLEDNPRDYDGEFDPEPDSTTTSFETAPGKPKAPAVQTNGAKRPRFDKWQINPPPPDPHWKASEGAKPNVERVDRPQDELLESAWQLPGKHQYAFQMDKQGVYQVYASSESRQAKAKPLYDIPTLKQYYLDLEYVINVISDGPNKSFAWRRLKYLESKFNMYLLLNEYSELAAMKRVPHRDIYNVRKVDTHIHHSACMNQKHLLRFIKFKMKRSPDDVVIFRDGKHLTLAQVFESLNLTAYDLSIDTLDMHAHQDSFHRFDKFNLKYNPIGESRLREVFLKTDNYMQGRYLAELTKEVMNDLSQSKYQMAEWRISIYGRDVAEWDKLAKWVVNNKLFSAEVRWLIQFPRLYNIYKQAGTVSSFGDVIRNIFQPLFEVTQDPQSHPELHVFLQRVIGFDSVDDESKAEKRLYRKYPFPADWDTDQNPPYNYWIYYLFANTASLNSWRQERGFSDTDHLTSAFLTCHSISHGILLRKVPALQYLYYLKQIGIAMSPLSNNALFLTYERNPLPTYFRIGLNVSLSTDDPLMFAFTKEPLLEEYSCAAQIYRLSPADMCELARNSVLQSGFEMEIKRHWLGKNWWRSDASGNTIQQTNVPDVRIAYRQTTLAEERAMIWRYSKRSQDTQPSSVKPTVHSTNSIAAAAMMASRAGSLPEHHDSGGDL